MRQAGPSAWKRYSNRDQYSAGDNHEKEMEGGLATTPDASLTSNLSEHTSSQICFHLKLLSHDDTMYFRATFIACCVFNAIFAVSATVSNAAIIVGVWKTPSLHTPSNVLFCGLAACGVAVGALTQPSYVAYKAAELTRNIKAICWMRPFHHICTHLFTKMLLFILTEISVERFLGVHLLQKYRTVVTSKRTAKALAFSVIAAALITVSIAVWKYSLLSNVVHFTLMSSCVLVTTASYLKVYFKLKKQQAGSKRIRRTHSQLSGEWNSNMSVYKQSILTVAWLIGSVLFCSIPQICLLVVQVVFGYTKPVRLAQNIAATILFINATLNPLVWLYRNKRIRRASLKVLGISHYSLQEIPLTIHFEGNGCTSKPRRKREEGKS